jgi:hypothetical protein
MSTLSLNQILKALESHLVDYPTPENIHMQRKYLSDIRQHLADQDALPQPVEVSEEALVAVLVKHFMSEILRSFPNATTVPSYWHHEEKVRPILAALRAAGFKIMEAA